MNDEDVMMPVFTPEEFAAAQEAAAKCPVVRAAKLFKSGYAEGALYLCAAPVQKYLDQAFRIFVCTRTLDPITGDSHEIVLGELRAPEYLQPLVDSITSDADHQSFTIQPSATKH